MDFTIHNSNWLSSHVDTFKIQSEDQRVKKIKQKIKLSVINCVKCGDLIREKHLYAIRGKYWHKCCVKCDNCKVHIDESGFLIDNSLLCRICYNQTVHAIKCFGCKLPMQTHEDAMYALNEPYHLSCFKCNYCKNVLSKGDKFVFNNGLLICKEDYENGTHISRQPIDSLKYQSFKSENQSELNGIRRKTKISSLQKQYLENYYSKNLNPSIKQRAYIAEELNLPVKVIQTWFCNYRTKMKMLRSYEPKVSYESLLCSDHNKYNTSKVKRMLQEHCFSPEQDCANNCQVSQSTEDHASPQDMSSDLSCMYGKQPYNHSNHEESVDDSGLIYADLSNSCVKSIDRTVMGDLILDQSLSASNFKEASLEMSKTCLAWS